MTRKIAGNRKIYCKLQNKMERKKNWTYHGKFPVW